MGNLELIPKLVEIMGTYISICHYKRGISPMAVWTLARVFPSTSSWDYMGFLDDMAATGAVPQASEAARLGARLDRTRGRR